MPRSRPSASPLSFHKHTGQYYVTRGGKRQYLGADAEEALAKYHRQELGFPAGPGRVEQTNGMLPAKDLANRFIAAQQANWRSPNETRQGYRNWLRRFLMDHPRLQAQAFTVEMFASWKLSLRDRGYSPRSINHFLSAVRAMYRFAEEAELIEKPPRLSRVKNERRVGPATKELYQLWDIRRLLAAANLQLRTMVLLGLNCGFGPKDIQDLTWEHINGDRATLPRSKTGVCQTFRLWPETLEALDELKGQRLELIERMAKRGRDRSDQDHVFMTKFWRPWSKDAVAEQFRKLCKRADVECRGFYRLRHCASTAMALVATPHVQRRFMRHSQLQQQVTYTHVPDAEVDAATMKARAKLLGVVTSTPGNDPEQAEVA